VDYRISFFLAVRTKCELTEAIPNEFNSRSDVKGDSETPALGRVQVRLSARHSGDGETVGSGGGFDSGLTRLLLSIAGLVTQWTQPDGDGDAVENVA
jgi:hypothetical protein